MTFREPLPRSRPLGLTRFEVILMVALPMIVGAVLILPALPHRHSKSISCISNLKQVALAELLFHADRGNEAPSWSTSTNKGGSLEYRQSAEVWRHFQALSNELTTPKILHCPDDKERKAAPDWPQLRNLNLSYFVNLNGDLGSTNEEIASTTILFGDRLIESRDARRSSHLRITQQSTVSWKTNIHRQLGCIAFADGSVAQLTTSNLQKLFESSNATQPALLAIP